MMRWMFMATLSALLLAVPARAQDKVAEGEYTMRDTSASDGEKKALDHWVLYTRKEGGYRLETEVNPAAGADAIVVQTEELNEQLNPTAIGVKLYTKEDRKKPFYQWSCQLTAEQIECKADGQRLDINPEAARKGPVLFAMTSQGNIDLTWMIAAAINRAHREEGTVEVPTLLFHEGETGTELLQIETDTLHAGDKEIVQVRGAKVRARRYSFENSDIKCWIADSGLLVKMEYEEGAVVELEKFTQYKKLVPELPQKATHSN